MRNKESGVKQDNTIRPELSEKQRKDEHERPGRKPIEQIVHYNQYPKR